MKRNILYKLIIITFVFLLALTAGGCTKATDFFDYNKEPQAVYKTVNKAYLAMSRVKTLNPVISKDKDVYFIGKLLYNSLFKLDDSLLAQNDLAESYHYDIENNRIIIKIKSGIKWSNGDSLTANDVKFSIDSYKNASYRKLGLYSSHVANIGSVSIIEDVVTINYMNGNDMSLENLTFPIISQKQYKNINDVLKQNEKLIPVCSGAYLVESYNPYAELDLMPNKYYSGTKPENTLIFEVVPGNGEVLNMIEPNLLTIAFSDSITRDVDFANLNSNIQSYVSNEIEWVGFNLNKAPFSDKMIRRAISGAIDTNGILNSAYYGNGVLSDSIYYPGYWGTTNSGSILKYNKTESEAMLEKAGYSDSNNDGILEDKLGNKFIINILVNNNNESRIVAANSIKRNLEQIKIEANIVALDFANYKYSVSSGNFDIYLGGSKIDEDYDLRSLLKSNSANPVGYKNPTIDVYLDQMKSGIKNDEKVIIYNKVKTILSDEIPYFPLVYKTYGVITSKAFFGTINPIFNNIYAGAEKWGYNYEEPKSDSSTLN